MIMMTPIFRLGIIFILIPLIFNSCKSDPSVSECENGIILSSYDINLKIQFYSENIVRIIKWPHEGRPDKLSLSVIQHSLPKLNIKYDDLGKVVALSSPQLQLRIEKQNGQIHFLSPDTAIILRENDQAWFTPVVYSNDSGFTVRQNFELSADEGIYGLGQHQYGYFNYRGKTVKLVQTNTDAVNPFLISTKNYGILWDNYSKTIFNDENNETYLWSDMGDNIDYYFISGKNMDQVISGYRFLTGKAPMYGKWAYGYWQSKEHYDNRNELMAVAHKYRNLRIPIDNIIQDWDYWNGRENWGGMFFDKKLFPQPEQMIRQLHQMNFHMIISIWPALGPNTDVYSEMQKNNFLYKPVGWAGFKYYDAFNPDANRLYWKYLKSGLYSKGLDGWWIDSTEPDVVNALTKESSEYELKKMGRNHLGSWARYLNAFSLVMTEDLHKFWRQETSDRRAYILTRSTYAGQQRNAATTWSGDIGANWDVYRNQISAGLNHSMSGIPYWTFDIGAFVIGAYDGLFSGGGKDPAYQELYTRMFQLGTFSPIFRSHGSETPRELWEMGEFTKDLVKFDHLRYRLLPYIYSLAWQVTKEDYTIMRGLPMDFAQDKKTYSIADQFMFGPAILVCPVTEYMYHRPPESSIKVGADFFETKDGRPGLVANYYKDNKYKTLGKEQTDSTIDVFWYTGRPEFVTDSMFAIRWEGNLIPGESGKHQFHMKSFDAKRIILDGHVLPIIYSSVEQYTDTIDLVAGKKYNFIVETENTSTGAARMQLFWKTPEILIREKQAILKEKTRSVYLPAKSLWYDFWTGKKLSGDQYIESDAPIDKIPLYVKAGSIIPMGPFIQYSTEKPADPVELRIYPGANGHFQLYEDENDNYNYETGLFTTIDFRWDDKKNTLSIGDREGEFPGMLKVRTINIVIVNSIKGTGIDPSKKIDKIVKYNGRAIDVFFSNL